MNYQEFVRQARNMNLSTGLVVKESIILSIGAKDSSAAEGITYLLSALFKTRVEVLIREDEDVSA